MNLRALVNYLEHTRSLRRTRQSNPLHNTKSRCAEKSRFSDLNANTQTLKPFTPHDIAAVACDNAGLGSKGCAPPSVKAQGVAHAHALIAAPGRVGK